MSRGSAALRLHPCLMAATRFAGSGYNFHAAPDYGAAFYVLRRRRREFNTFYIQSSTFYLASPS
ncbi:MAG: hypothetical protein UHH87_00700 [Akkermansia sp.]|nr:hypothetical protein [Akkermansia sp.]